MPYLQRNGFRIYYHWDGDEHAPVLILSHSLGADHRMWEPQVEMLKEHFHILRYDHPGHGESDVRPRKATIADFGADVLALMDNLGIERANFCGLSLGGMTGLWLGANAPQRFARLVISSACAHFDDTSRLRWRIVTIRRDGRLDAITESVLNVWFTPAFREREREQMVGIEKMFLTTQVEGYAATAETVCELDLRDDLARISVPTLVIYGSDDHATTPAQNRFLQANIPGAREVCVTAAHLANVESPNDFSNAVCGFLLASH
jgi:3-oxoadipate enol-lactonase